MSNVDKYFTQENSNKVFLCHINDEDSAKVIELQCYYDTTSHIVEAYSFEEDQDTDNYIDKIIDVIEEVVHEYDDEDSRLTPEEIEERNSMLVQENVYSYNTNTQLNKLIKLLYDPIVEGDSNSEYGLVYYYGEYDDFSCYGDGWAWYAKIINCAVIEEK